VVVKRLILHGKTKMTSAHMVSRAVLGTLIFHLGKLVIAEDRYFSTGSHAGPDFKSPFATFLSSAMNFKRQSHTPCAQSSAEN
jgi:hypothetical protein